MPPIEKTETINGLAVRFWEAGDANGYPIVLLHGGIGDAKLHWGAAIPLLADEYHVIAPDLPGFGGSAPLNGGVEAHVTWIGSLLDAFHIDAAVLVGNSFGGLLVRAFATYHPTRVPAAIITNGGIMPNIPQFFAMIARTPFIGETLFNMIGKSACSRGSLNKMIHVKSIMSQSFVNEVTTYGKNFGRTLRLTAANPIPSDLNPKVPTLVLWGIEDKMATVDEAKRMQQGIPGAKLVEIEACGHMPQLEEPDVFAVQVKEFLHRIRNPRATKLPSVGKLG